MVGGDLARFLAYVAVSLGVPVAEGSITGPEPVAAPVLHAILSVVVRATHPQTTRLSATGVVASRSIALLPCSCSSVPAERRASRALDRPGSEDTDTAG